MQGRQVLVDTRSIAASEQLSRMRDEAGAPSNGAPPKFAGMPAALSGPAATVTVTCENMRRRGLNE